ncbi:MAG: GNAT family N-acetyltransferase [Planctomycetes bacterium]|nr:GNAT family N-acetyltransferase [Planctomycetota bacterium]
MAVEASQFATRRAVGFLARLRSVRARNGWLGVARRVMVKAAGPLLAGWRRIVQHRNHVFMQEGPAQTGSAPPNLTVVRCDRLEDLAPELLATMRSRFSPSSLEVDRWELGHGAVLWVGLIDGRLAGVSMSRRGDQFKCWFVPLRRHDVVIFRNRTLPDFRGRGLCPALMQHVMFHELAGDGRAYVDCRVYNKPSIRSIEKAGFRRIATMKPLRRKDALGE